MQPTAAFPAVPPNAPAELRVPEPDCPFSFEGDMLHNYQTAAARVGERRSASCFVNV